MISLTSSDAQTFKQQFILSNEVFGVTNLDVSNFDNNLSPDILASQSNKLVILNNATSSSIESKSEIILAERAFDAKAVDLDSDGDMDIVSGAYFSDDFFYFIENENNEFLDPVVLTQNINGPVANEVIDLNQDQNLDIVIVSRFDNELVWLQNLGDNIFGSKQNFINSVEAPSEIRIVDFDLDGNLDVLIMSRTEGYLKFYKNEGQLSFNLVLELDRNFRNFFTVCDLNNDGLLDVVAEKTDAIGTGVSYYENLDGFSFEETKIPNSPGNVSFCSCADLNNDGNMDLVLSDFQNDNLDVHIGDGDGNFTNEIVLEGNFSKPINSLIADIDMDGDMDIIVADEDENTISLFENSLISGVENISPELKYNYIIESESIILNTSENNLNYQILNVSGAILSEGSFSNDHIIPIEDLSTGVYFLRLFRSNSSMTHKLFKH